MCRTFGKHYVLFICLFIFADNFTGSKDMEPYKTDVSFLCQYIILFSFKHLSKRLHNKKRTNTCLNDCINHMYVLVHTHDDMHVLMTC